MPNVSPQLWVDPRFMQATDATRQLWLYLVCGPKSAWLPGLVTGECHVSAGAALRRPDEAMRQALEDLIRARVVAFDAERRLILVADGLADATPGNHKVLKGWFRRWQQLADCAIKDGYVALLKARIDRLIHRALSEGDHKSADGWSVVWSTTFGNAVRSGLPDVQQSLFDPGKVNGIDMLSRYAIDNSGILDLGSSGSAEGSAEGRVAGKPQLQFRVCDLLDAVSTGSQGRVVTEPYDSRLTGALTAVIRECMAQEITLDDVRLAGEWIAAGGISWELDSRWVSKTGNLIGAIAQARAWDKRGRSRLRGSNGERLAASKPRRQDTDLDAVSAAMRARVAAERGEH